MVLSATVVIIETPSAPIITDIWIPLAAEIEGSDGEAYR